MDEGLILGEPETEDDEAYTEIQRLRSLRLPVGDTTARGYTRTRVFYLWERMKQGFARGGWDFMSLLEEGVQSGLSFRADYVAIDEVNDLTPLQLAICERAEGETVVYAGDLDQCIYGWAGVDPEAIRRLAVDSHEIRQESYRLPSVIAENADRILKAAFPIIPKKTGGEIQRFADAEGAIDLLRKRPQELGSVLILGRTNHILERIKPLCEGLNMTRTGKDEAIGHLYRLIGSPPERFTLTDAEALTGPWLPSASYWKRGGKEAVKMLLRSDKTLTLEQFLAYGTKEMRRVWSRVDRSFLDEYTYSKGMVNPALPLVSFSTFHGSKGLEADTVVLLTDSTERVEMSDILSPDEARRLAYVAATRCKERLYITTLDSQTQLKHF